MGNFGTRGKSASVNSSLQKILNNIENSFKYLFVIHEKYINDES
jgi:hypothetical protein